MAHRMGRKPKHYSQVARITFMLRRLIGGATVGELAEELQVTKRQVHRDLQQLEESGYPLCSTRHLDLSRRLLDSRATGSIILPLKSERAPVDASTAVVRSK